ncbi:hypothetical protein H5410_062185 [Solanum commersonii]|uniref:Uncharacterized protein n=1 Tax=Solanum commersonii TaxID=4109 RepID=A0A9J5W9Q9_SOLCO|nr:hypothetical protein H5410_062185 [Solanum commersonii]
MVPKGLIGTFSNSNSPQSSQLVPRGKQMHFKVQTCPKVGKHFFCLFSCAIVHCFLVIQNSSMFLVDVFHGRLLRP